LAALPATASRRPGGTGAGWRMRGAPPV